jgi:transposase InsO family protein
LIDSLGQKYPIYKLLRRFGVAESSYYYMKKNQPAQHDPAVVEAIESLQTGAKGRLGCRPMKDRLLLEYNLIVAINRILTIMRNLHNQPIPLKKVRYSSYYGNVGLLCPNLLLKTITHEDGSSEEVRDFTAELIYDVIVGDVTEGVTSDGVKVYVGIFRDVASGKIVASDISLHPNMDQQIRLLNQLKEIIGMNPNTIIHTDQGHLYQLSKYQNFINDIGWRQSMSRKGNCLDNCFAETWFSRFKNDIYFGFFYENFKEIETAFYAYVQYYNYVRTCNKTHMTPQMYIISHPLVGEKQTKEDHEDDSKA